MIARRCIEIVRKDSLIWSPESRFVADGTGNRRHVPRELRVQFNERRALCRP